MKRANRCLTVLALGVVLAGCDESLPPPAMPVAPAETAPPSQATDPLGPKPELGAARSYEPPVPQVFKAQNGMTIWLLERHSLPIVSVTIAVPYGGATDPKGKAGLAHIATDMMDEGAGRRDAVALSTSVNDLGASLGTGASLDGSHASLTVLKKNFKPAFEILSDVVARPRFEDKEWKRVSGLWKNELKKRSQDPASVARVVAAAALYGTDSPYGHPADGLVSTAAKVDLPSAKAYHATYWRPDQATMVVAGDITKAELMPIVSASLDSWKAPARPPEPVIRPHLGLREDPPRLVLVDRADAPQSVIAVVREGTTASAPDAPLLDLINTALGGSFTSRLNQDLREDHGWTYGAASAFSEARGTGAFSARASVVTEATGKALQAMLADIDKMATAGLSDAELEKVKAQDRADLVQSYETVSRMSQRLSTLAVLGLPPSFDANASRTRQQCANAQLTPLADAVATRHATIVVVGPRAAVTSQLASIGLGPPEIRDAEGAPIKGAAAAPARTAPPKAKK